MITFLYALLSVGVVSLISFVGVFALSLKQELLKKITSLLVGLSVGVLLGDSFIHMLPELAKNDVGEDLTKWLWILGGILIFFILEKIVCWRHCHIPTSSEHPHQVGVMNIIGDGLHNFIDGIIIGGSYLVDAKLGLAATFAIIAHEIPQEISDFGILLYAGFSRKKALLFNFLTALTAVIGAAWAFLIGARYEAFLENIVPFTIGGFIYIATADLIPELKKEDQPAKSLWQLLSIAIGIGIMLGLKFVWE